MLEWYLLPLKEIKIDYKICQNVFLRVLEEPLQELHNH
jgi:hypothetical protein